MILVDTSVWIGHVRYSDDTLVVLLERSLVATHPFTIGELALGSIKSRTTVLSLPHNLPHVTIVHTSTILDFVERQTLVGRGIGYVDIHLLASFFLSDGISLWTRDKRLSEIADSLGRAADTAPYDRNRRL